MTFLSDFPGEVFVDENGDWLGGLDQGYGAGGAPFGFVRCLGTAESCVGGRLFRFFDSPPCCGGPSPRDPYLPVHFAFGVQSMEPAVSPASAPAWDSTLRYGSGELVTYGGVAYVATWDLDSFDPLIENLNKQPDINIPTYWVVAPDDAGVPGQAWQVHLPGVAGAGFGWCGSGPDSLIGSGAIVQDSGWHPQNGECWKVAAWVTGYDIGIGSSGIIRRGFSDSQDPITGEDNVFDAHMNFTWAYGGFSWATTSLNFPITMGVWTYLEQSFTWVGPNIGTTGNPDYATPLFMFFGDQLDGNVTVKDSLFGTDYLHDVKERKGYIGIAGLHLYRCVGPDDVNRAATYHGHGPVA